MTDSANKNKAKDTDDWQPFTTFIVEYRWTKKKNKTRHILEQYRTHVHILENGEDAHWEGIEGKPAMEWMLNHVVKQTQGQFTSSSQYNQTTIIESPIHLNLAKISVTDEKGHHVTCVKGGHFIGFVSHESPLKLEAVIEAQGMLRSKHNNNYCRTDFFAIHLADGEKQTLGSTYPAPNARKDKLIASLVNVNLSSGVYTIRAVTVMDDHKPALDYLEGAFLIVI